MGSTMRSYFSPSYRKIDLMEFHAYPIKFIYFSYDNNSWVVVGLGEDKIFFIC